MPMRPLFVLSLTFILLAPRAGLAAQNGWKSLFDGKTLDGWTVRGGHATYKVEDGAIVGTTGPQGPNTFLCRGAYGDFELQLEVNCDPALNSGVQIRSHVYEKDTPQEGPGAGAGGAAAATKTARIRKAGEVYGYQCEIAERSAGTAGNFWDEARRTRWLDDFAKKPAARDAFKDGAWNRYRIVAQGKRIRSWVNGVACADFEDDRDKSGFIGLQVHSIKEGTGPYQVRWRNLRIRELAPGEVVTQTFRYKTTEQGPLELVIDYPLGWTAGDRRPCIVFFFGGGWQNGRITQFESQAAHLAALGMVAARADYRVKSRQGVTPDRCVEDAKSAVRWIRANAAKLGIDPDKIIAAGGSAGGHIAACTSLSPGLEADGEDLKVSSRPAALVLFNPVLRFDGVPELMKRIGDEKRLGKALSPTLHVTRDTPPTLLLYGTKDRLLAQGKEYLERTGRAGSRAELFTAEGVGHGFFNRPPWLGRTTARMEEFLRSLGYLGSAAGVGRDER